MALEMFSCSKRTNSSPAARVLLLGRSLFSCCWGGVCSLAAGEELSPYPKDVMLGTNYVSHAELIDTFL